MHTLWQSFRKIDAGLARKAWLLAPALAALMLLHGLASAGELIEEFDKTFALEKGHRFTLKNTNGSIKVYAWEEQAIRIQAVKRVKSGNRKRAEELMRLIEIEITEDGGDLHVRTRLPKSANSGFLSWLFDGGNGGSSSVSYTVYMPADIISEFRTVNGKVYATDVEGDVEISTTNGGVEVENLRGAIRARTTNGSLSVELTDVSDAAEIDLRTTNGRITVYLPAHFGGRLVAKTTNGSISTDFPVEVEGGFIGKRLEGRIGDGNNVCTLSTVNGSIKIRKSGF